ncbi:helix-turn-helix domain-containing protein [Paenibacillus sp. IB182496]|uniref:Helix-turn-helix domain-containing protein n=1 Tax=Paenibacillus sabuli TaxID=2772509 RepID=A0A927GV21_9BACL|nr:helix-turn-helix domain-containing protein [Paenibacillus sabuli]MBD2848297.1 helix-turn-helix domain-containing protein [Paenibacillus sabuli]
MQDEHRRDEPADYPIYRLRRTSHRVMLGKRSDVIGPITCYRLVVWEAGCGQLQWNARTYRIGGCGGSGVFLIPPSALLKLEVKEGQVLRVGIIGFDALGMAESESLAAQCEGCNESPPVIEPISELLALHRDTNSTCPVLRLERHVRFEQLLLAILRHNTPSPHRPRTIRKLVEQTLDTIHGSDRREHLSVQALADACSISARHYTRIFTALAGESPLAYWTGLRIRRSIRELVRSGGQLAGAAQQAGYGDTDSYSRRFKDRLGISPARYWKRWSRSPRIVALQCAGDLLALGIEPVAMMTNGLSRLARYCTTHNIPMLDRLAPAALFERIATRYPDLIVAGDYLNPRLRELLSTIAPTLDMKWSGASPLYHLDLLAQLLGRELQLEQWRLRYAAKREQAVQKHTALLLEAHAQSAAVYYLWMDQIRVYFPALFPTFYKVLGYAEPTWVHQWKPSGHATASTTVDSDSFPAFTADRIFAIIQDDCARATFRRLQRRYQHIIPALSQGRCRVLDPDWHSVDATSLAWQLDVLDAWPSEER